MSEIIDQKGERLSFFKLFSERKYSVQIPIIQRDYAQGRINSQEVRENFLDALYDYLEENIPNRDLDFVYGSLNDENGKQNFVPLDGQQRLTTLFLLHWYLYQICDDSSLKEKYLNAIVVDGRSMFTYETRSSSSEFCDALMNSSIDFSKLMDADVEDGKSLENELSKTIKNFNWFYLSWQFDPTIQSMLNMLDSIHYKFKDCKSFFGRLLDEEHPIITFLFLNLKDFLLTDDLYIKMNSRGKPLSDFENFKALFEQSLDNVIVGDRKFYNFGKEVSLREYFEYNIDTKWADLFWNYRDLQSRENKSKVNDDNFDDEFVNFIRAIFASIYAVENQSDANLEHLLGTKKARDSRGYYNVISYHKYSELEVIFDSDKEAKLRKVDKPDEFKIQKLKKFFSKSALFLIDALDCLWNHNERIKNYITNEYSSYYNEDVFFENALQYNFETNAKRILFYAYIKFLVVNKGDYSGANQWMRVVSNLTHPDNRPIDDVDVFVNAIKEIDRLSNYSGAIIDYLSQEGYVSSPFYNHQGLEEKVKAKLIKKSSDWEKAIVNLEKHCYFNGQIGFALEFAGIIDFYKSHYTKLEWSDEDNYKFFKSFVDYSEKASKAFEGGYDNRKNNDYSIFERAVLTKGDYFMGSGRRNMLNSSANVNNIKRDNSWKRLLRIDNNYDKRQFVKALFDDSRFDVENYSVSLNSICKDRTGFAERDFLIECPKMMGYAKQGFIGYEGGSYTIFSKYKANSYHVEFFTYHFWLKWLKSNSSWKWRRFENVHYEDPSDTDIQPGIYFERISIGGKYYSIYIYFEDDKLEINVCLREGKASESEFAQSVKDVLSQQKYIWNYASDDFKYFEKCFDSEQECYDGFCSLYEELCKL